MIDRSRCLRRQLDCCVGWRAAVAESPTAVDIARRVADVEAVLRHPPLGLDVESIRDRLVEMVGEDDERVTEWDSIIRDVREAK